MRPGAETHSGKSSIMNPQIVQVFDPAMCCTTPLVPWLSEEPVGAERLQDLFHKPELTHGKD